MNFDQIVTFRSSATRSHNDVLCDREKSTMNTDRNNTRQQRDTYELVLRSMYDEPFDCIRLRRALKALARVYGFRALSVKQITRERNDDERRESDTDSRAQIRTADARSLSRRERRRLARVDTATQDDEALDIRQDAAKRSRS